jgi:uncharacterized protein
MARRKTVFIFGTIFFLLIIIFIFYFKKSHNNISVNGHTFFVEIASTPEEQTKGLSGHPPIKDNEGMLFIFTDSIPRTFWMKNMLYPLDIIWINDNKIINISKRLPPEGETPKNKYYSEKSANSVLEINGGLADKLIFKVGDQIITNFAK